MNKWDKRAQSWVHVGADANAHINQLRLELENAEMNAKARGSSGRLR